MDPFSQPPFDLLSGWFVINGLSRSLVNPVVRLNLRSLGSIPTESSDWFSQGRGRMFGDDAVLVIDLPGAIKELSDFHASFGIGSPRRSGGNIDEQFSQAYGIIPSHFGGVVETDDPVHIERFG